MTVTTLADELVEHAKWRALVPAVLQRATALVHREFAPPSDIEQRQLEQARSIHEFAARQVPYYRDRREWWPAGAAASSVVELLERLPVLRKADVRAHFEALRAEGVPHAERGDGTLQSSGTTGAPTRVLFNARRHGLDYVLHSQRHLRAERIDPAWSMLSVRRASELGRGSSGGALAPSEVLRDHAWPYVGSVFRTGRSLSVSRETPLAETLELIRREAPEYLVTYPGTLETLVLAARGKPSESLGALRTVSATLTEGARSRIASLTGLSVLQNYGLNEMGLVATRCSFGRYHVNAESFVVEIVDDDGRGVAPGETGRLLVTALTNPCMPLLRYDSGDLAEAVEGPCACGRTLPSFGKILGRYRPMHHAPPGTGPRVNRLMDALDAMPAARMFPVREYQLHQFGDGSFVLRLVVQGELDEAFERDVTAAWLAGGDAEPPLRIEHVDRIPLSPGGKQQEFSSDFFPTVREDGG